MLRLVSEPSVATPGLHGVVAAIPAEDQHELVAREPQLPIALAVLELGIVRAARGGADGGAGEATLDAGTLVARRFFFARRGRVSRVWELARAHSNNMGIYGIHRANDDGPSRALACCSLQMDYNTDLLSQIQRLEEQQLAMTKAATEKAQQLRSSLQITEASRAETADLRRKLAIAQARFDAAPWASCLIRALCGDGPRSSRPYDLVFLCCCIYGSLHAAGGGVAAEHRLQGRARRGIHAEAATGGVRKTGIRGQVRCCCRRCSYCRCRPAISVLRRSMWCG